MTFRTDLGNLTVKILIYFSGFFREVELHRMRLTLVTENSNKDNIDGNL